MPSRSNQSLLQKITESGIHYWAQTNGNFCPYPHRFHGGNATAFSHLSVKTRSHTKVMPRMQCMPQIRCPFRSQIGCPIAGPIRLPDRGPILLPNRLPNRRSSQLPAQIAAQRLNRNTETPAPPAARFRDPSQRISQHFGHLVKYRIAVDLSFLVSFPVSFRARLSSTHISDV